MECAPGGAVGENFGNSGLSQREAWIKRLRSPELDEEGGGGGERFIVATP